MKEVPEGIKKEIFQAYIDCKLSMEEIADHFKFTVAEIEMIVHQYANNPTYGNSPYYRYMAAKLKRRKMKEEEEKKKQEEQARKSGKKVGKSKEEKEQNTARELMKAFLNSGIDRSEFCKHVPYGYFKHQLALVYDCDRHLYKEVKHKFYTDYISSLKEDEERISEEEYEKRVDKAKEIMTSFMTPSYAKLNKKEFCEKSGNMSIKYFDSMLYILKDEDADLYDVVNQKIQNDILLKSNIFKMLIIKMAKVVKEKNKAKESFTIYDYYTYTKVQLEKMLEYANEFNMPEELDILQDFYDDNKGDLKDITLHQAIAKHKGDSEYVEEVFEYLTNNEFPITVGTFEMAMQNGVSKRKVETREMDVFLVKSLKLVSSDKEAKDAYNKIKAKNIQDERQLANI